MSIRLPSVPAQACHGMYLLSFMLGKPECKASLTNNAHCPQGLLGKVLESDNWCRDWKMIMYSVWKEKGTAYFVVTS